jgi:hypothetical protein
MTTWSDKIHIQEKFQRSTRIDSAENSEGLEDFILQETGRQILERLFAQLVQGTQRAFTWTGPYGSGKSSLARFLIEFLRRDERGRQKLGIHGRKQTVAKFGNSVSHARGPWLVIRVAGSQADPTKLITAAAERALKEYGVTGSLRKSPQPAASSQEALLSLLEECAKFASKRKGGLLLVIDEMGKVLDHAAQTGGDLHLFQEIAERFGSWKDTSVFLGILHQSFAEYAGRVERRRREEWSKIQGRFEDVPFSINIEESLTLTAQAIQGKVDNSYAVSEARHLVDSISNDRFRGNPELALRLADCFPLHPLAALAITLTSRLRFGQNERSVFSFLASKEPCGFRSFLSNAVPGPKSTYNIDLLFDYLQLNLEQSILGSSLGHAWAEIIEAIERARRGEEIHLKVLKAISLLNLIGRSIGIRAHRRTLVRAFPEYDERQVTAAISDLESWSVIIHRRYEDSYVITEGSDLNIDNELELARGKLQGDSSVIFNVLTQVEPVIAKGHYHQTGTLRWFEVRFVPLTESSVSVSHLQAEMADGLFLVGMPDLQAQSTPNGRDVSRALRTREGRPVVVGISSQTRELCELALEVAGLQHLSTHLVELQTDKVARREVAARLSEAETRLSKLQRQIVGNVNWFYQGNLIGEAEDGILSKIATRISNAAYDKGPIIRTELLNRHKPSSAAIKARRSLMLAMVSEPNKNRFGLEKYPAEVGIYMSVMEANGLHGRCTHNPEAFEFKKPRRGSRSETFTPIWEAADAFVADSIASTAPVPLSRLYSSWSSPPFGLRSGIIPLLALTYILSRSDELALYVDGRFEPTLDDYLIDRISRTPSDVSIRLVSIKGVRADVMRQLSLFTEQELGVNNVATPLDAARQFAQFAHRLHPWVKRTERLSVRSKSVRQVLLAASDPHALLFVDLPASCGFESGIGTKADIERYLCELRNAHAELRSAFDNLKDEIRSEILTAFGMNPTDPEALSDLRHKAKIVVRQGGDFQLDALLLRFEESLDGEDVFESIASLVALKPVRDWNDDDILSFKVGVKDLAQRFSRILDFVHGRDASVGNSIALYVTGRELGVGEYRLAIDLPSHEARKLNLMVAQLASHLSKSELSPDAAIAAATRLLKDLLYEKTPLSARLEKKKGAA